MWAKIYLAVVVLRLQSQALLVLMMIAHGPFRKQPGFDWSGLNGVEDKDYIDGILRMACGNLRWSRLNTFLRHSNLISAPLYLPTLIIILPTLDETSALCNPVSLCLASHRSFYSIAAQCGLAWVEATDQSSSAELELAKCRFWLFSYTYIPNITIFNPMGLVLLDKEMMIWCGWSHFHSTQHIEYPMKIYYFCPVQSRYL